ncbi:hypothetical protein QVD17_09467 [Tagetes erecta]|uniref:PGG domain-containing protein n=1 Tax=Tagetes erecta TaxID=13708 RepID=A0AAD8NYI0_TARER|nr:hypothetical protein QVD17_09467 [Tagetes erecta]
MDNDQIIIHVAALAHPTPPTPPPTTTKPPPPTTTTTTTTPPPTPPPTTTTLTPTTTPTPTPPPPTTTTPPTPTTTPTPTPTLPPKPTPTPTPATTQTPTPAAATTTTPPPQPNLPRADLLGSGSREDYIEFGIPLYEAAIIGDWKAAEAIFLQKPELVRCSITENGETALHIAASAKKSKRMQDFVKNLVGKMEKPDLELQNKSFNTALCLAAAAGNVEMVDILLTKNPALLIIRGSQDMMPLYMAALFGDHATVKYMYGKSKGLRDDGWDDQKRDWLLLKCVESNLFDIALEIVTDCPKLASNASVLEVLARKPEAFVTTTTNVFMKLYNWAFLRRSKPDPPKKDGDALELLRTVWRNIAKKPRKEIDDILRGQEDKVQNDNRLPYNKEDQSIQLLKLVNENMLNLQKEIKISTATSSNEIRKLTAEIKNSTATSSFEIRKLTEEIKNSIATSSGDIKKLTAEIKKSTQGSSAETQNSTARPPPANATRKPTNARKTYSSRILFVAAEMGNTTFIVELIRLYPDLIWKVNDNNQTIFHIAVRHRHESIYNLLYEIGSMKDLITPIKDENDNNNMLHLVGKSAKRKRLQDVSGVALQMQRELLWFEEVKDMIPPSYRERKNKDGMTPHELFTKEHKELVSQGEKWMKDTASQCMVVAALIATIVFAAAFTVPGGYNQDNQDKKHVGIPIFHSEATFMVFVVADALSLFASAASILMFLSILTSRYAERDFLRSLPLKLMLGLAFLFLSITTMTVAFSVSFFVLYKKGLLWMPCVISFCALLLVLLFLWLQYPLLGDVFRSTYGSRYLFRPKKQLLYDDHQKTKIAHFYSKCLSFVSFGYFKVQD